MNTRMLMSKLKLLITTALLMTFSPVNSETTAEVNKRLKAEKQALTQWVMANAHNKISQAKASKIVEYVYKYSTVYDLDPLLVLSIAKTESGFRENAVSSYGAMGLMQVVPRYHTGRLKGRDPNKVNVSIEVGADILSEYMDSSKNNLRVALKKYSGSKNGYYKDVVTNVKSMNKHIASYLELYGNKSRTSSYRVAQAQ